MGLVPAFLQPDVSQAVQLLQGHEVDAALDAPLVDLRGLRGRREGMEAGGTAAGNSWCKRGSTLCYGATVMSLGFLREPPAARSQGTAGNNREGGPGS